MPNKPNLEIIGKELLENYDLQKYRYYFTFDFEIDFDKPDETNNLIKKFIKSKLKMNFDDNFIEIIHKQILEDGLNWHIDDCVIVTKKSEPIYNKERYIKISDNKYLYFHNRFNRLPISSIIFYSSTYAEDFTGGILKLCDGIEIIPIKGNGIILDSREVHMVTPVKYGNRYVTLVKIY
jgi:hypothetical protein